MAASVHARERAPIVTTVAGMQRRNRPSARVVMIDEHGAVLLIEINDPLAAKPRHWITPGGGVEAGESPAGAAVRELAEETGLVLKPDELGAPIAMSRGDWEFRGVPLYSETWHFGVVTERFELDISGWDAFEREFQSGWRWWGPDEVEQSSEFIIPAGLAGLARMLSRGERPTEPIELPWSTGN